MIVYCTATGVTYLMNKQMNKYQFLVESGSPLSIPLDKNFWRYVLTKAKAWGSIVYEQVRVSLSCPILVCILSPTATVLQDWLYRPFQQMKGTWSNVTVAHTWLHNMGDVAAELNFTIQYCLSGNRTL